ncbi:MAG: four helix bundle protein [Luteolibacter sp.]
MTDNPKTAYDLEERLLDFGARIIALTQTLTGDYAQRHIANQLLRSETAPLANHGETQAAESPADFIHKLRISLKELRETHRWLRLIERAKLIEKAEKLAPIINETDQLIRIFVPASQPLKNTELKSNFPE